MRNEDKFKNIIRDVGYDPFFVHYQNAEQIHMYRKYCSSVGHSQIIIDATGSVVKNFTKCGFEKTKNIFLYEAIVYDRVKNHSFTITNMLSERHNTISIANWLANWMSCNVPMPKMTVCDQSLALLSAIIRTFTQYTSLKSYVDACADILTNKVSKDSHWLPQCYVKLDIAHFMKLASKWPPLKRLQRKVREVILRTIGNLVKCEDIENVYALLLSLFIAVSNSSRGVDKNTGNETSCEKHCRRLLEIASTGIVELDEKLDEILEETEKDSITATSEEQNDDYQLGLSEKNPFQTWAEKVYEESKLWINEDGNDINPLYAPEIVPHLIKMMKLLPLWSYIMVPFFGYGEGVSSSAAVESSFNKLKNGTFKHITLPTDLETFLENHMLSLRGASLLHSTDESRYQVVNELEEQNYELLRSPSSNCNYERPTNQTDNLLELQTTKQYTAMQSSTINLREVKCPLCKSGSLPSTNGAHKCSVCSIPVHALLECSMYQVDDETLRICLNCYESNEKIREDEATDNWSRRSKKQLKSSSYSVPNPHLRHIDISNPRNPFNLPLLKNGSRAEEIKSCYLKSINENVILSNTCAFDSIASLLMVSFCDSKNYSNKILEDKTYFVDFISKLVSNGISKSTYMKRAEIIISHLKPNIEKLEYNTSIAICDTTPKTILKSILSEFPTFVEKSSCTNNKCAKYQETCTPVNIITYNTTNGDIHGLQKHINNMKMEEVLCNNINEIDQSQCTNLKKISYELSSMHLFIEILLWKGNI